MKRWIDGFVPLVMDDNDPLGTSNLASDHLPLESAPEAYEMFQKKNDGAVKIILHP